MLIYGKDVSTNDVDEVVSYINQNYEDIEVEIH
ncbi:hypothetical protein ACWIDQ_21570, partial [Heyndrickxia sporothermodurans]